MTEPRMLKCHCFAAACDRARRILREKFPDGVPITRAAAKRAAEVFRESDLIWFIENRFGKDCWRLCQGQVSDSIPRHQRTLQIAYLIYDLFTGPPLFLFEPREPEEPFSVQWWERSCDPRDIEGQRTLF